MKISELTTRYSGIQLFRRVSATGRQYLHRALGGGWHANAFFDGSRFSLAINREGEKGQAYLYQLHAELDGGTLTIGDLVYEVTEISSPLGLEEMDDIFGTPVPKNGPALIIRLDRPITVADLEAMRLRAEEVVEDELPAEGEEPAATTTPEDGGDPQPAF